MCRIEIIIVIMTFIRNDNRVFKGNPDYYYPHNWDGSRSNKTGKITDENKSFFCMTMIRGNIAGLRLIWMRVHNGYTVNYVCMGEKSNGAKISAQDYQ